METQQNVATLAAPIYSKIDDTTLQVKINIPATVQTQNYDIIGLNQKLNNLQNELTITQQSIAEIQNNIDDTNNLIAKAQEVGISLPIQPEQMQPEQISIQPAQEATSELPKSESI